MRKKCFYGQSLPMSCATCFPLPCFFPGIIVVILALVRPLDDCKPVLHNIDEHGDEHHDEGVGGDVLGDEVEEEDDVKVEEPV